MRKTFLAAIILFACMTLWLTGCNSQSPTLNNQGTSSPAAASASKSDSAAAPSDQSGENVLKEDNSTQTTDGTEVRTDGTQSWPTSKLYDVPEWEGITQYNGGGVSLDDYVNETYSMIVVAGKDTLAQYLDLLKSKGWTIGKVSNPDGDSAELGAVSMKMIPQKVGIKDSYEVDISLSEVGSWPKEELPGFLTQLGGKEMVGETVFHKPGDDLDDGYAYLADSDGYNLMFEYTGLTKSEATAYIKIIADKLKGGKYSGGGIADAYCNIKGTFDWKGTTYNVSGEVTEMDDNSYSFAFGWSMGEVY